MNEMKTIKDKISEEDQIKIIDKIINEEFNNQKLIDALTTKFKEKGFPVRIVTLLFSGEQDWIDILELARVAFIEGAKDGLEWEILDSNKWFDNNTLSQYDAKVNELKTIDSIYVKNMIKIDDFNYLGYIPLKTIHDAFNNALLVYNKEAQRASTYKKIGTTGKKLREISLNEKSVEEIKRAMIDGTYEEDMIIYNVMLTSQDIIPQVKTTQKMKNENIYDVEIVPNYDRKSKNYTIVNIADGYHRTIAGIRAYSECLRKGIMLDKGLPLKITVRDLKGAQNIVNQIFKRTDTKNEWLDVIQDTDYNDFVNLLVKSSKILNKKVVRTRDEYDAMTSITYSSMLSSSVEKYATNIPVNSKLQRKMIAEKMANIIDELFEYLLLKYETIDKLIAESYLADVNIFIGYLAIANELRSVENYEDDLIKIGDKLLSLTKEDLEPLKLISKDFSVKRIYEYFQNIAKEVTNIEK